MVNKVTRGGGKFLVAAITMCACICSMVISNVSVAYAEKIIHTHIWATKYDDKNHWEYCTVCGDVKDKAEHKCVDHWFNGTDSCVHNNFSNRICECGYNYTYKKPHSTTSDWKQYPSRILHYNNCTVCGSWIKSERCSKDGKELSCKNTGKCDKCGGVVTKNYHFIAKDGKCRDCGEKVLDISKHEIKYSSDYKTATVTFTMKPVMAGAELTGSMSGYTANPNYSKVEWSKEKQSDGKTYKYTGVYTFDEKKQRKCTVNMCDSNNVLKINGEKVYVSSNLFSFTIWQDQKAPEVDEVKQVDQKTCGEWATIKELTISGKEDLSKIVTISIIDKESGDKIVDKAQTDVKDDKFSYKCTPPLEGPVEGRSYILKVEDEIGNVTEKEFKVYRTDCRAPIIRSEKEYTEWSKTKNLVFKLTDYGAGKPMTSILDQVNYVATTATEGGFNATYTFSVENYGVTEYKLYVKDGLGNAALEKIKVGKIDNTKPTVTEVKHAYKYDEAAATATPSESEEPASTTSPLTETKPTGAIITVSANDKSEKLKAEGSGVAGYALVKSKEKVDDSEWQEFNSLSVSTPGTYYLWVKDKVGNYADVKTITIKDDFSMQMGEDVKVDDGDDDKKYQDVPTVPSDDKDKDKEDKKSDETGDDTTPKTGDTSFVLAAGIMLVITGGIIGVFMKKKRGRFV